MAKAEILSQPYNSFWSLGKEKMIKVVRKEQKKIQEIKREKEKGATK